MNVTIIPTHVLAGEITAPPSKAHTHRAVYAGLLSRGATKIENPLSCDDTDATANAVSSLGAKVSREAKTWIVHGQGSPTPPEKEIDCGESGVTLRFTIPIASLTGARVRLTGKGGLMRRPIEPLTEAMNQLGVKVSADEGGVSVAGGPPSGGNARIRGDISSQFISGLLLAAPMMRAGLRVEVSSRLESRNYVSLTLQAMKHHGIEVRSNELMSFFEIPTGQSYRPTTHKIPGDYSSAAFVMSAAAVTGSKLLVRGLQQIDCAPDSAVVELLTKMGVRAHFQPNGVLLNGGSLKSVDLDLSDCPDLGPVMAVLGCFAEGQTRIIGARRLRYKESDRLGAVVSELGALGGAIKETEDGLIISGPCSLRGGTVHSHGDHRIAMALSVAAIGACDPITITEAECVNKSYPAFFHDLRSLGVEAIGG